MSISRWCRTIVALPRGRVLLRNLLYDIDRERIPAELVTELLDHVRQTFRHEHSAEEAAALVDAFRSAPRTCRGQGGPDEQQPCSRVLDEGSCFHFNIDAAHYGVPIEDEPPTWFFERLARRPLDSRGVRGQMNTGRGFVWVTRRQDLDSLTTEDAPKADLARQRLGLDHLRAGMRLLALHYPEELPWSARHAPPTAIEAGASVVFRSTEADDGWGRAVDLETLGDGLPELTHEPVDFTVHFEIEPLGPLSDGSKPTAEVLADATAPMSESWLDQAIVRLSELARSAGHERIDGRQESEL